MIDMHGVARCLEAWHDVLKLFGIRRIRGPQYKRQHTIILIIMTPQEGDSNPAFLWRIARTAGPFWVILVPMTMRQLVFEGDDNEILLS